MKNYYSLLGLESNASKAEIKKNYRKLASKFHPDKNSDPNASSTFIAINEAYEVLSNKKTRAQYDLLRWETSKQAQQAQQVEDYFAIFNPRKVSLRTKRNKAQEKRSLKYHQFKNDGQRYFTLFKEAWIVSIRYSFHFIGIFFSSFILKFTVRQLLDNYKETGEIELLLALFIVGIFIALFKIIQNFLVELQKDTEAFSIFYKLSFNTVIGILAGVILPIFCVVFKLLINA